MKDFLSLKDLAAEDIISILNLADKIKKNPIKYSLMLEGKVIVLLFQKTSTRTRISFESGMYQLGGNAIFVDWTTTNLHLGSLADEIRCISAYVDLIIARVNEHNTLEEIRKTSDVPVVNGLSDIYHPCQTLADLMTIREKFGSFDNIKVAWTGDGNNVCNSLIIGCVIMNIPISVATPEKYQPHPLILEWVRNQKNSNQYEYQNNPKEAVKNADIVYTDTFVSIGQENESEDRLKIFAPYQINSDLLSYSKKTPYVMHCLPAHRGVEITNEVLDSNISIVFDQAENRLHVQKALMLKLLRDSEY